MYNPRQLLRYTRLKTMDLNSKNNWLILFSIISVFALPACSTTPSSPQPPDASQPPMPSSETTSKPTSKASQTTQSHEERTQGAASKADSTKPGDENAAEHDIGEANQGTHNAEGVDQQFDKNTVPTSSTLPTTLPTTKTVEERTLELDQKLNKSLSTFDGKLLKERQILEDQEAITGSGSIQGGRPTADSPGSDNGGSFIPGDIPRGSPNSGENPQPASPRGKSAGQQGGGPPTPPDIPDGHDDDIIARQLREAAENEADPKLREKLWEEYRKYKKGGRS